MLEHETTKRVQASTIPCSSSAMLEQHGSTHSTRHNVTRDVTSQVEFGLYIHAKIHILAVFNNSSLNQHSAHLWGSSAASIDVRQDVRCSINTFGDRSFAAAGARQWNSFQPALREQEIRYTKFKRLLEAFLFY